MLNLKLQPLSSKTSLQCLYLVFAALNLILLSSHSARAESLGLFNPSCNYFEDFQTSVGSEWATTGPAPLGIDNAPLPIDASRKFLGRLDGLNSQFAGGLISETVSLSLNGLAAHSNITLSFDLFIIQSWDGTGPFGGPDVFKVDVAGGPTLLNTTFSNVIELQHYPASFSGNAVSDPPVNPAGTSSVEQDTLGYYDNYNFSDTVYHLTFTFPHTSNSVVINFSGIGLTTLDDESWGLDNVSLEWACNSDIAKQANTSNLLSKLTLLRKAIKKLKLDSPAAKVKALKTAYADVLAILSDPALDVFLASGKTLADVSLSFSTFKKAYKQFKKRKEESFDKDKKKAKGSIAGLIKLIAS